MAEEKTVLRLMAETFDDRAKAQGWKPKSAAYAKAQLEFFMGARALAQIQAEKLGGKGTTQTVIPDMLLVVLSVGRSAMEITS